MNQGNTPIRTGQARFYRLSQYLRNAFGKPVRKITIDGGFTCPNRDGSIGEGGCIFCDPLSFSPSRRRGRRNIREQITEGIGRLTRGPRVEAFIAYFQPGTNTHAPVGELRRVFEEALGHSQVVGLAIGTRPDCLGEPVLDVLAEFHRRTWLCTEIGLQTIHDRTLRRIRRGHDAETFFDAAARMRGRGLRFAVHVIVGLPDESREEIRQTANTLAREGMHSVKIHNPYITKGAPLKQLWRNGEWPLPAMEEYVSLVADFLERLPPECVIERLTGEAPREYLVAPDWCLGKAAVIQAVESELRRRGTRQGDRFEA